MARKKSKATTAPKTARKPRGRPTKMVSTSTPSKDRFGTDVSDDCACSECGDQHISQCNDCDCCLSLIHI